MFYVYMHVYLGRMYGGAVGYIRYINVMYCIVLYCILLCLLCRVPLLSAAIRCIVLFCNSFVSVHGR